MAAAKEAEICGSVCSVINRVVRVAGCPGKADDDPTALKLPESSLDEGNDQSVRAIWEVQWNWLETWLRDCLSRTGQAPIG